MFFLYLTQILAVSEISQAVVKSLVTYLWEG